MMRPAADREDETEKAAVTPGPLAPARELLGEMLLEAGRPAEALAAFEATVAKEPNRFRGVYGAARAAEQAGDRAKATQCVSPAAGDYCEGRSVRTHPALTAARAFLAKVKRLE